VCFRCDGRPGRDGEVALAQDEQASEILGRRRSNDSRRAADSNDIAGECHLRRDKGAFTEEHAIAESRARHENRRVPDFAQIADGCPDHQAAMAKRGAPSDRRRDCRTTDHHRVLEHRRSSPDLDTCVVRADHSALGQQRTLTQPCCTDHHRRAGDLGAAGHGDQLLFKSFDDTSTIQGI
jgi:hypothetical protein